MREREEKREKREREKKIERKKEDVKARFWGDDDDEEKETIPLGNFLSQFSIFIWLTEKGDVVTTTYSNGMLLVWFYSSTGYTRIFHIRVINALYVLVVIF